MMDRRTPTPRLRPTGRAAPARRAFTLIELMVSIAMVLVIMLGVNAIFKMASDTVNAGQALAAANRDNRSVQSVLYDDVRLAAVTDGPMLLIRSERVSAFRNREDQLSDLDYEPTATADVQDVQIRTVDLDGSNTEGDPGVRGELTPQLIYNTRNHRIDRLSFFGTNLYRRQTGTEGAGTTTFIDEGTSFEAYHWLGHLNQPNFNPDSTKPSRMTPILPGEKPTPAFPNPNNFYATDWILGRSVTLLNDNPAPAGMPNPPNYIADLVPTNENTRLRPLAPDSKSARTDRAGTDDVLASSRYDLADTSITQFRSRLQQDAFAFGVRGKAETAQYAAWWEIMGGSVLPAPGVSSGRFQGYPYPDRPLTPYGLARTVPVFLRGCTQFTVEFAGDYLRQDPDNGQVLNSYLNGPTGIDGQVDYLYVVEQPDPSAPAVSVRRVRWYGMPRNVETYDDVAAPVIAGNLAAAPKHGNLYDVIPLRDLLMLVPGYSGTPADYFEHFVDLPAMANYAVPLPLAATPNYYAAWGPNDLAKGSLTRPKMLRITMTVDDPNGRMTEGQTFEYVIDLP